MINYIRVNFLLFNFQPSSRPEQTIFHVHTYRLDCQTRLSDPREPRSDHHISQEILPEIRPPRPNSTPNQQTGPATRSDPTDQTCPTATPNHQIRSPHQTTGQHPRLFSFWSAQHTQSTEMVQVRCIPYGLGQGGYIELWMNLAKHTFHTRSAWNFRTFFSA